MSVSLGQWNEEITCRTQFHLSGRWKFLQNRPKWFTYCVSGALRGCYFSLSHFPSWIREDMFHGVNLWNKKLLEILQVVHLSTHWKWKSLSCLWHDCSPPGFSVLGILQARILEWVAIPFSGESSQPRDRTQISHIAGDSLPSEPPGNPKNAGMGSLSLLQGIFPAQELNPGLLHCRQILYQLSYQGSTREYRLKPPGMSKLGRNWLWNSIFQRVRKNKP